ncbi:MAG: Holliday junction branch migration protein RuvA [Dehalococcoidia bacterium]|nr:Holliday junction branch migration protein RuvA [Dehalococcoidia bacterium]
MIAGLDGILEAQGSDFIVVKVSGVSFKVFVPTSTLAVAGSPGDRVRLRTHLQVREDNLSLYGFATAEELEVFELAITVSGVGPRLALSLLSALNPARLAEAICSEDVQALTGVPGVGKKTASHLILELKDKLSKKRIGVPLASSSAGDSEVIAALRSLGYTSNEAAMALASVPNIKNLSLEEKVRLALQGMGKR